MRLRDTFAQASLQPGRLSTVGSGTMDGGQWRRSSSQFRLGLLGECAQVERSAVQHILLVQTEAPVGGIWEQRTIG